MSIVSTILTFEKLLTMTLSLQHKEILQVPLLALDLLLDPYLLHSFVLNLCRDPFGQYIVKFVLSHIVNIVMENMLSQRKAFPLYIPL